MPLGTARQKLLEGKTLLLRSLCGAKHGCTGVLCDAILMAVCLEHQHPADIMGKVFGRQIPHRWDVVPTLLHELGGDYAKGEERYYYGFADSGFRLGKHERSNARRRVIEPSGDAHYQAETMGQSFPLPALVFCPDCNRLNFVPDPDDPEIFARVETAAIMAIGFTGIQSSED